MNTAGTSGAVARGVVLLTELFPPDRGGSAVLFGNIYERLTRCPVTVIRHAPNGSDQESAAPESGGKPLRIIGMPMTADDWGVMKPASVRRYARVIARLSAECRRGPSLVHCGRALPEGLAALGASRFPGGSRYLCWTHGEELQYARSSRELTFLLRRVHRGAAALIANSVNTARELSALGVEDGRIHVVHPGVDWQTFARSDQGRSVRARYAPNGEPLLVTVGRLQRRKGHDLAIQAMASLQAECPSARYLIVGQGDEQARLEQLARSLGVGDQVVFVGGVSAEDLPDYYAAADVFVHPNRIDDGDVEGFGIVFLEAAAAGVPTIGGRSGGVPEAIADGETGLLVSGTDVAELAATIRRLLAAPELRQRMGAAARARVQRQFTWERAAAQVHDIHLQLSAA